MTTATPLTTWLLLALVPVVLVVATCFTKSSVVLAAVRTALGAEQLLPLPALLAVAVVLTAVVMAPTLLQIDVALAPWGGWMALNGGDGAPWLAAFEPLRAFMLTHADPEELEFFAAMQPLLAEQHPLVLVPAFLVTELAEALHMAVIVLVPFVVIDLLAAQAFTLMAMPQIPLALITLPVKLLLFLAIDGWDLVLGGLVQGYR